MALLGGDDILWGHPCGAVQKEGYDCDWTGHTMARVDDLAEVVRGFSDEQHRRKTCSFLRPSF
jgi:hypothetical protein